MNIILVPENMFRYSLDIFYSV